MPRFNPYEHLKIVLNKDGTLERPTMPRIPPNPNPTQEEHVASKDITINTENKLWVRIYIPSKLPSNDNCVVKLPIIVYFPTGGFINHNVADLIYHEKCNHLTREIPSIVVSVNYRQAPENRLPAQYEDGMEAITWIQEQGNNVEGEKWLREYADFSRCYLMGMSNGGNIAYNVALRALDIDISPVRICGMVLNQPMFSGKKRTESELKYACDEIIPLPCWDLMWELALPKGVDRDHRYCNPMVVDRTQQRKISKLGRFLVMGYGMDPMVDKQQEFVSLMVRCGANVEAHFDDIGFHGVDLVDPKRALFNLQLVKDFIK